MGLLQLGEAGRVDVQRLHVNQDLVVVDGHIVVDQRGSLWQHSLRLDHAMAAELTSPFHR
jgi:hypothetical protein